MARSVKARVDDMRDAITGIRETLNGVDFETYCGSWLLQRATERGLEIISEASRSLPADWKAANPHIPWPHIAAIGNVLRHEYQRTEPLIIWNIVQDALSDLEDALRQFE
ncbi:DUF86 domain-containing protein [Asticcacaulis sp. BYS171W]|uniref:DUF86 domain-containing protein n=1 Tax=Asticcacaulis aquaticus TaxID=2984212 RepID=A0ABT5HVF9_9CAUL|nr:HepT-like ribonuclease domain-containing protein [Asticcacaulis aquaticus]MDC7684071.1 DUF86 domain-containing protein [Asticcacaulis aquaticus]